MLTAAGVLTQFLLRERGSQRVQAQGAPITGFQPLDRTVIVAESRLQPRTGHRLHKPGYRRQGMVVGGRGEWCRDRADILDIVERVAYLDRELLACEGIRGGSAAVEGTGDSDPLRQAALDRAHRHVIRRKRNTQAW